MRISLVGMSGSGKTYWSKRLEEEGFTIFDANELLEDKLGNELKKLGYKGIRDVARWMGQPYEQQYSKTSSQYLAAERETMLEILDYIEKRAKPTENILIDTTGSVIYTGDDILERLSRLTTVVFLDTPSRVKQAMYMLYLNDPKPVIWGDMFGRAKGESKEDALAKSYQKLLEYRLKRYKTIADVTLDYHQARGGLTTKEFLDLIKPFKHTRQYSFF